MSDVLAIIILLILIFIMKDGVKITINDHQYNIKIEEGVKNESEKSKKD